MEVQKRRKIMCTAPQEMARLRSRIAGLKGARMELLKNLVRNAKQRRNAVAGTIKHFGNERAQMARKSAKERKAFLKGVKTYVNSMQAGFYRDLAGIHHVSARMALLTRQERASFVSALKNAVKGMRVGFLSDYLQMARKTKIERLSFIADQKNIISGMRADFRREYNKSATDAKRDRLRFISGLKADSLDMRTGFRRDLADCGRSNAEMFRGARAERSGFVSVLKQAVAGMRREFSSDIAATRLAWLGAQGSWGQSGTNTAQSMQMQPRMQDKRVSKKEKYHKMEQLTDA